MVKEKLTTISQHLVRGEITHNIHSFMGNAYNIDACFIDYIEN